jgi:Na+-driven multidrug efflux pump
MGRELRKLATAISLGEIVGVLVPLIVMAMMGRMGSNAVYLRALYVPLALLFAAIQAGVDIGNQILTSISRGKGRPQDVVPTALSVARVGMAVWCGIVLIVMVSAPALAALFQVDPGLVGTFVAFTRWMCLSTLLSVPVVLCASSLRGYGHPRSATMIILLGAALEISLMAALGFGTGLGVYSLPVAVAASSVLAFAVGVARLRSAGLWQVRGPSEWRPEAARQMLSAGLPVAMSFIVMALSNMGLFWALAPFGPKVVSGYASVAMLGNLLIVPASGLASAAAITMNRLRGAGEADRAFDVLRAALRLACLCYGALAAFAWLGREQIAALLGSGAEVERFLAIVGLSYFGMGLTVMAVILMEQIGAGAVALLLNIPYFGGIVIVGSSVARAVGDPAGLYTVTAVLNASGLLLTLPILWRVVGGFVRKHSVVKEPESSAARL